MTRIFGVLLILFSFTCSAATVELVDNKNKKKELEKTPKSLFLIKKIKISPEVGEPQFDPAEAQLRTVINDTALHDTKKFE